VGRRAGKTGPLLWNDAGVAAGSAGRWNDWRDTAPGRGCRNAGIDFCRWTNHTLDRDNSSLKLALPVVSPCAGTAKPPVLAWQPRLGVDETDGGAVWSDCACAFVTAATTVTPKEDELDEQEYLEAAARRSPANREQILNDRSLRQHERPSNRLGGTETVSRSSTAPGRPSR
jgi:hypothetical protein